MLAGQVSTPVIASWSSQHTSHCKYSSSRKNREKSTPYLFPYFVAANTKKKKKEKLTKEVPAKEVPAKEVPAKEVPAKEVPAKEKLTKEVLTNTMEIPMIFHCWHNG